MTFSFSNHVNITGIDCKQSGNVQSKDDAQDNIQRCGSDAKAHYLVTSFSHSNTDRTNIIRQSKMAVYCTSKMHSRRFSPCGRVLQNFKQNIQVNSYVLNPLFEKKYACTLGLKGRLAAFSQLTRPERPD